MHTITCRTVTNVSHGLSPRRLAVEVSRYFAKLSGSRLAPPTSAPSMSGCAISSSTLSGLTEPPYWIRIASAASPKRLASQLADEGVHLLGDLRAWPCLPVPMAQTGS